jgi:hypothetical protein
MSRLVRRALTAVLLAAVLPALAPAASLAGGLADDGGAQWSLEQPPPPEAPAGVEGAHVPIGLGAISDIAFYSPNRGALITAGNGSTIAPGVWLYNGAGWHQLSEVCGASDRSLNNSATVGRGHIVWVGPDEFWTISDGRAGQARNSKGELPPLEDDTLCRFALDPAGTQLEVADSYASPAFQSTSYQPMDAGACITPDDCWFAGELLPAPQVGAFQLHWNGHRLTAEPFVSEGHQVGDMIDFEGRIIQSVRVRPGDLVLKREGEVGEVPAVHAINPEGDSPQFEALLGLPLLAPGQFPGSLDFLHLSTDGEALWAAAGAQPTPPHGSDKAGATVLRYSSVQYSAAQHEYVEGGLPEWRQIVGSCPAEAGCEAEPPKLDPFPGEVINSIAAEPGERSAWVALANPAASNIDSPATLARVSADGTISDRLQLPEEGEPRGAAEMLACPAAHDCWLATGGGWLFHLSTDAEREQAAPNGDPAFSGDYLVTERPADEGVAQQTSTAVPADDSGLEETGGPAKEDAQVTVVPEQQFARVTLPLLSNLKTRLVHRTTLVLSFHLSVKAKLKLVAKRRKKVVASSPTRTLDAGNRSLEVHLNLHSWPTKLNLESHALEPLKTVSTLEGGSSTNVVTSSLVTGLGNRDGSLRGLGGL